MPSYAEIASRYLGPPKTLFSKISPFTELRMLDSPHIVSSDREIEVIHIHPTSQSKACNYNQFHNTELRYLINKYKNTPYTVIYGDLIISPNGKRLYNQLYREVLPRYVRICYDPLVISYYDHGNIIMNVQAPYRIFCGMYIPHNKDHLLSIMREKGTPIQIIQDGDKYLPVRRHSSWTFSRDNTYIDMPLSSVGIFSISLKNDQRVRINIGGDLYVRTDKIEYKYRDTYTDVFHRILPLVYTYLRTVPVPYRDISIYV